MQHRLSALVNSLRSRAAAAVPRGTAIYPFALAAALSLVGGVWMLGGFQRADSQTATAAGPATVTSSDRTHSAGSTAAAPSFSFADNRPIAAAGPDVDTPVQIAAAATQTAPASFADTRPLPAAELDRAKAADQLNASAASFSDARPLNATSFEDGRLVELPPLFQDRRPVAAPIFTDERLAGEPAFNDVRPVAAPSFNDDRVLAVDSGREAVRDAVGTVETPVASTTPPAAIVTVMTKAEPATAPASAVDAPAVPVTAASPPAAALSAAAAADPVKTAGLPTLVAVSPSSIRLDATGACSATEISTEPLDGGQMRIRIAAGCHAGEAVQISYGGAEFIRKLNAWGALDFVLDCFAGSGSAAEVRLADGSRKTLPVVANDLDKVSKIAVVWRAATNLDLHVFEYGSRDDEPGHLWAKAPSSISSALIQAQADKRGHGVLSAVDDGETLGDKVEVYTFVHNDEQATGAISMALDYESRGEKPSGANCGSGALAEVDFQVNILPRNGQVSRQAGILTRVDCGSTIPREARFNQSALPVLRIKK